MLRVKIFQFLRALNALAASYMAGKWAVGYAFQERGYDAVGSEYMFALATYLIVFKVSGFLFVRKKKKEVCCDGSQKDGRRMKRTAGSRDLHSLLCGEYISRKPDIGSGMNTEGSMKC